MHPICFLQHLPNYGPFNDGVRRFFSPECPLKYSDHKDKEESTKITLCTPGTNS